MNTNKKGAIEPSLRVVNNRDEFDKQTKENIAKRVGWLCSNPNCRRTTTGPHSDSFRSINIGVASHICGAASGGPRYDPNMTLEDRKADTNGIWLCQVCAKTIDNDVLMYSVEKLHNWKKNAEDHANQLLEGTLSPGWASVLPDEFKPLVSLELTTPPATTRHVAQTADGRFWLVYWNSIDLSYSWEKITEEYAADLLRPVAIYRNLIDWRELF